MLFSRWVTLRRAGDRGMATAELAVCLPILLLVLAGVLSAVSVAAAQVRAQDAAREAARAAARWDDAAVAAGERVAPGAEVSVSGGDRDVSVSVRLAVRPLGPLLGVITVVGRAAAVREPRDGPP